jgi:hypothetical protein
MLSGASNSVASEPISSWRLVEPARPALQAKDQNDRRANPRRARIGGADRDRTDDLKLAKLPLSQLSYGPVTVVSVPESQRSTGSTARRTPSRGRSDSLAAPATGVGPRPAWQAKDPNLRPTTKLVGLSRLELLTSRLSGVCSNHLSYRPGTPARPAPFGGGRGRSALNRT